MQIVLQRATARATAQATEKAIVVKANMKMPDLNFSMRVLSSLEQQVRLRYV
jgi:hypothetical protein